MSLLALIFVNVSIQTNVRQSSITKQTFDNLI